jgi:hypothetical protein
MGGCICKCKTAHAIFAIERSHIHMGNQLFRKESLDRISSPEQLHDYMRVTSPRMWMILSAIAALLIGFIVYASTTTMESTININVLVDHGDISADVSFSQPDIITMQMPVRFADRTGYVQDIIQTRKLALELKFDSDTELKDGYYLMELDEADKALEYDAAPTVYLTVNNGIISTYDDGGGYLKFFEENRRASIDGKKLTVTDCDIYNAVFISIGTDDEESIPAGYYSAEIVTESTKPISFLLN